MTGGNGTPTTPGRSPKCDLRKLFPKGQVLAVVDMECGEHENVRRAHASQMYPGPLVPLPPGSGVSQKGRDERKRPENEQVIVLRPPHGRNASIVITGSLLLPGRWSYFAPDRAAAIGLTPANRR